MNTVSDSELLNIILPTLSPEDLLRLCQTDRRFAQLCRDESFWQQRVKIDYPGYINSKPNTSTWKAYYQQLSQQLSILVVDLAGRQSSMMITRNRFRQEIAAIVPTQYTPVTAILVNTGFEPVIGLQYLQGNLINEMDYNQPFDSIRRLVLISESMNLNKARVTQIIFYRLARKGLIMDTTGQVYFYAYRQTLDQMNDERLSSIYHKFFPKDISSREVMIEKIISSYEDLNQVYYLHEPLQAFITRVGVQL